MQIKKIPFEKYKTIKITITKHYQNDISNALFIFKKAGLFVENNNEEISIYFDIVDIKYLEQQQENLIVFNFLNELNKIKSYSSRNGKLVYASYKDDVKVKNKTQNKKNRLAYEYYKKDFDTTNNVISNDLINRIHCEDSYNFLKKLPNNCIDIILTSPPYNFGINYATENDSNLWKTYFDKLFNIFRECIRVLKHTGRIIINVQPLYSDYIPTHHIISNFFLQEGLIWKGEILWEKNNYNCNYCTWGSWKSPSSPYLKYSWEYIEIFCKNDLKKIGDSSNIDITGDEFKKFVYGKWDLFFRRKQNLQGVSLKLKNIIENFLDQNLKLKLSKWRIAPLKKGANFVGYRTWKNIRFLRKRSLYHFSKSLKAEHLESLNAIIGNSIRSATFAHFYKRVITEKPDLIQKLSLIKEKYQNGFLSISTLR